MMMNTTQSIREYIKEIPLGKPFTVASLKKLGSCDNVRQALSRLVKAGEVARAARGIFVRPKKVPYLGEVLPEARTIAEAVAKASGETIAIHGAEAARILHLSTQVPMQPVFYTTGNTRHIKMGKTTITLQHISHRKLVSPGTAVGLVISALWYLGKEHVAPIIIEKIKQQIKPQEFSELLEYIPSMPSWMADVFIPYQRKQIHGKSK